MLRRVTAGESFLRWLALRTLPFRILQPLPDGGLFRLAYLSACELLESRRDRVRVPVLEKHRVAGLLGGGIPFEGEVHMILFAVWVKALIF